MPSPDAGRLCVVMYNIGITTHNWCMSDNPKKRAATDRKWEALAHDSRALLHVDSTVASKRTMHRSPKPNLIVSQEAGPSGEVNEKVRVGN